MCGSDNHDWLAASAQMRLDCPLSRTERGSGLTSCIFDFRQQCVRPETVAFSVRWTRSPVIPGRKVPSLSRNAELMLTTWTLGIFVLSSSLLIISFWMRRGSSAVFPRGKMCRRMISVAGWSRWTREAISRIPSAVSCGVCLPLYCPVLLVPTMITHTWGECGVLRAESSMRHNTCSVLSPPIPKLTGA